jgi:hypothetical protein
MTTITIRKRKKAISSYEAASVGRLFQIINAVSAPKPILPAVKVADWVAMHRCFSGPEVIQHRIFFSCQPLLTGSFLVVR